jgi:ferrous iron transport protein B
MLSVPSSRRFRKQHDFAPQDGSQGRRSGTARRRHAEFASTEGATPGPKVHAAHSRKRRSQARARQDQIDKWLTHRVFGIFFFVLVMYAMFKSVYTLAQPIMGGIEGRFLGLEIAGAGPIP